MKKALFITLVSIFTVISFSSCTKIRKQVEDLNTKNDSLQYVIDDKNSQIDSQQQEINEYMGLILEVQQTIETIKIKSGKLNAKAIEQSGNTTSVQKEQMKRDITELYELLEKSKNQVTSLQRQLKSSQTELSNLNAVIAHLSEQLIARDEEISSLKNTIEKQVGQIDELNKVVEAKTLTIQNLESELRSSTNYLNTAWYFVGTKKELKSNGIIASNGRVISEDNKGFIAIDITEVKEFKIDSKKYTILSAHPASSYEVINTNKVYDKIVVTNVAAFWSVEKRLIIQIK